MKPTSAHCSAASMVPSRFLNIDNNAAERALRRVGIGRKNWLFAGHDIAAQRTATLYSLIASAERHGIDPQAYLRGVLARIPFMTTSTLGHLVTVRWACCVIGYS